jgi:hypothetical protein
VVRGNDESHAEPLEFCHCLVAFLERPRTVLAGMTVIPDRAPCSPLLGGMGKYRFENEPPAASLSTT